MWLKRLKYFLIGLGAVIILFITVIFSILYIYEEEIKKYALDELNQRLNADLKVENVELSIIDQFPSIAIKFNDLLINDVLDPEDTLLFASSLYMNMDLFDVVGGTYEVKKIIGDHVNLKLKVDSAGNDNYNIWIADSSAKDEEIRFSLQQVEVNDLILDYKNHYTDQQYRFYTKHIHFTGDFNKDQYDLTAKSHVLVKEFTADQVNYLKNKNADIDLNIKVNNDSSTYIVDKGDLKIEGMSFIVNGSYKDSDSTYVDLKFKGKNIILESLFSVFPIEILSSLNEYNAKGQVQFNAHLKGEISNNNSPVFNADFNMESGSMIEKHTSTALNSISLNGSFINLNKEGKQEFVLDRFKATLGQGKLTGALKIVDFKKPTIEGAINGAISLKKIADFANISSIDLSGNSKLDINYKLSINEQGDDYKIELINGNVDVLNLKADVIDQNILIENTNGELIFDKKAIRSNLIRGELNGSSFEAHLNFNNFLDYITGISSSLTVNSDIKIEELNLGQLISQDNETENTWEFLLPTQFNISSKLNIGTLYYEDFKAKKITGLLSVNDQHIKADNVNFYANNGNYQLNSMLQSSEENKFKLTLNGKANNINVASFFADFKNFGQDYLTDQHLKGTATISFELSSFLNQSLMIETDKLIATSKIHVKKGELIGHSSMMDIADYLDKNLLVKSVIDTKLLKKKLNHIHFSELSNEISIKNGIIEIPKMNIISSVMNMTLFGNHGFNDSIDYHFSFRLRELMVKEQSDNEFGPIKDDGLGKIIFLNMYGTVDNPLFKLDQEEKKQNKKEIIKEEKQVIKSVLKEELGLFSKDSTLKTQKEKKDTTIFEIEWEEEMKEAENKSINKQTKEKDTTKKKNGKFNKLLKKIGVEEEEKKEVEFEIDQND